MLRISKLTDYAIVVSTHLGTLAGAIAVSDLASATRIPQPTVSKVLKALADRLYELDKAAKEWLGLAYYWLLGWTPALFPAP